MMGLTLRSGPMFTGISNTTASEMLSMLELKGATDREVNMMMKIPTKMLESGLQRPDSSGLIRVLWTLYEYMLSLPRSRQDLIAETLLWNIAEIVNGRNSMRLCDTTEARSGGRL